EAGSVRHGRDPGTHDLRSRPGRLVDLHELRGYGREEGQYHCADAEPAAARLHDTEDGVGRAGGRLREPGAETGAQGGAMEGRAWRVRKIGDSDLRHARSLPDVLRGRGKRACEHGRVRRRVRGRSISRRTPVSLKPYSGFS